MFIGFVLKHWRLIAGVLIALALVGAIHIHGYRSGAAGVQQKWDAERARQTAAALKASEEARAEEQRRIAAQQEVQRDAQIKVEAARADAAASGVARDRLRDQLAAFRRAAGSDPTATASGAATGDPIGVLGRLFAESDEVAGALAEALDRSRIAGLACEASFDSLTAIKE